MAHPRRSDLLREVFSCWNWKCALLSATFRSLVYLAAIARRGRADIRAIVLVEIAYVTISSGLYAALQQRALLLRRRFLGNLIIVLGVPGVAQILDWAAHRLAGAPAPRGATLAVCIFAAISALFHLHVMRNGVFLAGQGRSLGEDFRRIPGLVAGFVLRPFALLAAWNARLAEALESDGTL